MALAGESLMAAIRQLADELAQMDVSDPGETAETVDSVIDRLRDLASVEEAYEAEAERVTKLTPPRNQGTPVYFTVDEKLHRGYRDKSGRFTLEQCNLSKANEANNLDEIPDLEASEVNKTGDLCGHCFRG